MKVDEAINSKSSVKGSLFTQLKMTCPKGVDVYFNDIGDSVGEELLDSVLLLMNHGGRIALCGEGNNHENRKGIINYS